MQQFNSKRIADPVHGTIGLSGLEARVISTRAFQRLRNVKQLGLAHYVFPGADYSRFSHSIGVCHVTGRILSALRDTGVSEIDDRILQLYRLAALLHDIGHYPFSHAMEDAIANHFSKSYLVSKDDPRPASAEKEVASKQLYFQHEELGKQVLLNDVELNRVLIDENFAPEEIFSIFTRGKPMPFMNLVSSDLDADRIDYLLRTAHHTGLPYGSVDLDYLLSQIRLDDKKRVCLTEKALKTADHFLLCRYFDYQQVAFHKTVAGLEAILKDVLAELIEVNLIDGSAESVLASIRQGNWHEFDDAFVLQKMRDFHNTTSVSEQNKSKASTILNRTPPKLLADMEIIRDRKENKAFLGSTQAVREKIPQWAADFGIAEELWYVWDKAGLALTKIGSHVPQSSFYESSADDKDKYEQEIRVLDAAGVSSKPIVEIPYSLMSVLADYALYSLRIYALLSPDKIDNRQEISAKIKRDLPNIEWK